MVSGLYTVQCIYIYIYSAVGNESWMLKIWMNQHHSRNDGRIQGNFTLWNTFMQASEHSVFLLNLQSFFLRRQRLCRRAPNKRCESLNIGLSTKKNIHLKQPKRLWSFLTIAFFSFQIAANLSNFIPISWGVNVRQHRAPGEAEEECGDKALLTNDGPMKSDRWGFQIVFFRSRMAEGDWKSQERFMGYIMEVWCSLHMAVLLLYIQIILEVSQNCSWMMANDLLVKTCFKLNFETTKWSTRVS